MKESIVYWAGHHLIDGDWKWLNQKHPYKCIWYVTQGSCVVDACGRTMKLGEGDIFVCRMDEVDSIIRNGNGELHVTACLFHAAWAPAFPIRPRVKDLQFISSLLKRLVQNFLVHGGRTDASSRWLESLLQLLIDDNPESVVVSDNGLFRIKQLCQSIDADPSADWKVDELAQQCEWSTSHFHRKFKEALGMAPREYISHARISAAQTLLCGGQQSVAEIASQMGYSDVAYFSKHFREISHCSPSEYKNRCRMVHAGRSLLRGTHQSLDTISEQIGFKETQDFVRYFTEVIGTHPRNYKELYRTGEIE